ncbi:hypothetical protein [Thauera humireducens]|uniref:hypothetical protein n=1 Tax=Thauera humireducens TaxID=1134435 RepID=UPI000A40730C|nr:hypothetical protein [Thauera humireducens]
MKASIGIFVVALTLLSGCEKSVDEARVECLTEASEVPTDAGVRQRVMLCHQQYPRVTNTNNKPANAGGGWQENEDAVDWSKFKPTGEIVNDDAQYGISVTRPSEWLPQERPSPEVRFMYGFKGNGYIGNCNVVVLHSPSTTGASQKGVDQQENLRQLPASFFEDRLRTLGIDAKVLNVQQTRRGAYLGHLVNYTYHSFSPSLNAVLHFRGELFSHSRPGRVYTITCLTGATSPDAAQMGFEKERNTFENFSAGLRVGKY